MTKSGTASNHDCAPRPSRPPLTTKTSCAPSSRASPRTGWRPSRRRRRRSGPARRVRLWGGAGARRFHSYGGMQFFPLKIGAAPHFVLAQAFQRTAQPQATKSNHHHQQQQPQRQAHQVLPPGRPLLRADRRRRALGHARVRAGACVGGVGRGPAFRGVDGWGWG